MQTAEKSYIQAMLKTRLLLVALVLAIALGLGLVAGLLLPQWLGIQPKPQFFNTATVIKQVQSLSQLVTVKYVLEKVVVFEDVKWFGESRVLLVAHGIVKAGVDLQKLKPDDISVSGKKISIKLPPARPLDAYLDDKKTQIIERSTGLGWGFPRS